MDMRAAAHASMGSEYVKSLVFGGLDGIITTFAVVCAACGAELGARVIVLMGVANLFADGISMGVGDYLSERAEEDCARSVRRHEEAAMRAARAATRARLAAVYRAKYFADAADDDDDAQGRADAVVDALLACGERAVIDALLAVEHGILSDEDDADGSAPRPAGLSAAARKGLVTGAAFIVFGAVPLGVFLPRALGSAALADALGLTAARVFPLSMVATSATLFGLGVCKGRVARQRPVWAGGEMLLNGLAAATAAYVIGF
ncbi:Ccc1 family, partial [Pelagophyceae sp. CCMP2097]